MITCLSGATTVPYGLAEDVRAAAAAGFEAIEVWRPKLEAFICDTGIEALAALLAKLGIEVASLAPYPIPCVPEIGDTVRRIRRAAESAARIGGDLIVAVPEPPPAGMAIEDALRILAGRLRACADAAAPSGVRIAVESRSDHPLLSDPRAALRLIRTAEHPKLGLAVGLAQLRATGIPAERLGDIPIDRLWLVRVTDGDGPPSIEEIIRTLEEIGYEGAVSVETPREDGWDLPIQEIAARAMDLLRRGAPSP